MPVAALKEASRRLLELLGRNQKTKRTGKWKPYMLIDAVHRYRCPVTVLGQKSGPCNCGAEEMCAEFDRILNDLRRATR